MKKLIIAAFAMVVLFGLALAPSALAAKPVKPSQIVYLVTLEGGDLDTPPDCGTSGFGLELVFGGRLNPAKCFSETFTASDGTSVTLVSLVLAIATRGGAIVEIQGSNLKADDGTGWRVQQPVPLSSSDYDGKKDIDCFTVTVPSGEVTLTNGGGTRNKKSVPELTITIDLGNIVFRTHLEDGTHPDSPDCTSHPA